MYSDFLKKADLAAKSAEDYWASGQDDLCRQSYAKAAKFYKIVSDKHPVLKLKEAFLKKSEECEYKADFISKGGVKKTEEKNLENNPDSKDNKEFLSKAESFLHRSSVSFNDVGGLENMKKEIKFTLGVSLANKNGLKVQSWRNWLFYGCPGVGKTLMAAATSNLMKDSNFYNVKVSSTLSKYFGDSAKTISALYEHARKNSPSVVFLDEFESLCGSRDSNSSGAEKRILSTILAELDGLSEKDDDSFVLTIAATNRPWDLDPAVLSRFDKRIHVPLPDKEAREAIFKLLVHEKGFQTDFECLNSLVDLTEGYSGREIEKFVKEVTNTMIMENNSDILNLVEKDFKNIQNYKLKHRPLTAKDFALSAHKISPVTTKKEYEEYLSWENH